MTSAVASLRVIEVSDPLNDERTPEWEGIARELAIQVSEQLPSVLMQLHQRGLASGDDFLQLECSLTSGYAESRSANNRVQVAAVNLRRDLIPFSSSVATQENGTYPTHNKPALARRHQIPEASCPTNLGSRNAGGSVESSNERPEKRRKVSENVNSPRTEQSTADKQIAVVQPRKNGTKALQRKRPPDNPALQPSTLDKFVSGVWDSIFSGIRMDPAVVIEQWQAIESSGQPKLLTDDDQELTIRSDTGAFGRMNVLTRKISQTSKTCRSLEIIVQAHWVQCFDDRVAELAETLSKDKAKKTAMSEACVDFNWTEKEMRNKMAIWRGYHDIKTNAGWAALVFAGTGLYRFCKYRVAFTEDTFHILRNLRHRFEVAADTLHPRWRILLGIVGATSTQPKYTGHPHDWVVSGPDNEAIPLPQTYHQWDKKFSYTHLRSSAIDIDEWGDFDPRTVIPETDAAAFECQNCSEHQSDDPTKNDCACYPNLYGSPKAGMPPLQVFRTFDGKNNGLMACCPFEKGWAVGEFVGQITTGLQGLDVMVDRTDRAGYQIWQGRQGNHTRFVNHSCEPNSHYERFVWLGKQRTVLVSKGIEAGEEITVDYGETYWEGLDKICKCEKPACRYNDRRRNGEQLLTPPNG